MLDLGHLTRRERVLAYVLIVGFFLVDFAIVGLGYLVDGWRGAAIFALIMLVQENWRSITRENR